MKTELHVVQLIGHLNTGGAENALFRRVQYLKDKGIKYTICLYENQGRYGEELIRLGYSVIFMRKNFLTGRFQKLPKFVTWPFRVLESVVFVFRLSLLVRRLKVDIIHTHMFSANLWGRLASIANPRLGIIITEHTVGGWHKETKHKIVNRILASWSDRIVAVSNAVAESVSRQLGNTTPSSKVVVIPNGYEFLEGSKTQESEHNISEKRGLRIASIGRLVEIKRLDILMRALKSVICSHPEISCWIVGDGPMRSRLERMSEELCLNQTLSFLGERYDVRELLNDVDVVISTSDAEGMSNTILEAMGAGLPVIATDVGGNQELVRNGQTGILIKPGDVEELANSIIYVLNDMERAKKMGETGKRKVEEFYSMEKVSQDWLDLYREVLKEKIEKRSRRE